MNKTSIITLSAAGIILAGLTLPKVTQAFWPFDLLNKDQSSNSGSSASPMIQSLIERLTQKFNLNPAEVQTVFDEVRTENQTQRRQQMQTRWADRLTQAVTDGKITEAQKQLILTKHQEVQTKLAEWQNLSFEDRKAKLAELKAELETWADENNIPAPFKLMTGLGYGRDGGRGFDFDNDNHPGKGEGRMMGRSGLWRD